ncbi:MAG: S4 domain-containing protein, partial [Rhodospirillales bacterium]
MRIDKWLWAARFYKTRSLASRAVETGKVELNAARVKPAREIRVGDRLAIRIGDYAWLLTVLVLSERRGPAAAAALMYGEDDASKTLRVQLVAERKLHKHPAADAKGRPTKRERRQLDRFKT